MKVLLDTVIGAEVMNQRRKLQPCGAYYLVGLGKRATEKYIHQ